MLGFNLEPLSGKYQDQGLSLQDAWKLELEIRRSKVRRVITYTFSATYLVMVLWFTFELLYPEDPAKPVGEAALAFFSGFSAAALGVIGFWFGNRKLHTDWYESIHREAPETDNEADTSKIKTIGQEDKSYTDDDLERVYQKVLGAYLPRDDVTAVDKGYRIKDGLRTNQIVVRIHTKKKRREPSIGAEAIFPREIDGVPIDVVESRFVPQDGDTARSAREQRQNVIQPGLSIGRAFSSDGPGTLGLIVYRGDTPYLLSNYHVLVVSTSSRAGEQISQPGWIYDGHEETIIAELVGKEDHGWVFGEKGDAAIARLLPDARQFASQQFGTQTTIERTSEPKLGMLVSKSGAASDQITEGRVEAIDHKVKTRGVVMNCMVIDWPEGSTGHDNPISQGGDSGSVWYTSPSGEGMGLHVGAEEGPNNRNVAVACDLEQVLEELRVTLKPNSTDLV